MNSICEIVRVNILGLVTTSWTYSTCANYCAQNHVILMKMVKNVILCFKNDIKLMVFQYLLIKLNFYVEELTAVTY